MPRVGFESTTPAFEREKTVHASYRAATVIGNETVNQITNLTRSWRISGSRRLRTAAARVQAKAKSWGHCGGQNVIGTFFFFLRNLVSPVNYHSTDCSTLNCNPEPNSEQRTKRTLSHHNPRIKREKVAKRTTNQLPTDQPVN
jgi:hypothetical protein